MILALPPSYVNVPVPIAYAGVDDALIVTMTRILGLCWAYEYERTPAFTPDQLSDLIGRTRTTMYRHLSLLEKEIGWLCVDHVGRKLILRPVIELKHVRPPAKEATLAPARASPPVNDDLRQALKTVGIENPMRDRLARDRTLEPSWVQAWHMWTRHPHRSNLTNPAGVIVRKLQEHEQPPDEYLQLAGLSVEERSELQSSYWTGGLVLDDRLQRIRPLYFEIYDTPRS